MAKLFALPPFSSMATHTQTSVLLWKTQLKRMPPCLFTFPRCILKGEINPFFFPFYFRETCYFTTFFFSCSSIQKPTAALPAEAGRPEERCWKETKEGEIWGHGNRRRLPRLLITSRVSATHSHLTFFFYGGEKLRVWPWFDPDSSPLVVTNSHGSCGNNLQQGPSLRAKQRL